MRAARHPASALLATGMLAVALVAILASGCGSSDTTGEESTTKTAAPPGAAVAACTGAPAGVGALRASGVGCATARQVIVGWIAKNACGASAGNSRTSCMVGAYRCLGTVTEHGLAVSCTRPGHSISFAAKRR